MTDKLHIVYKKVDDLIPYVNNSRTHDESQILSIASSIKEFGFLNPIIVDGQSGIVAGHGRLLAAKKLGITDVPCIEAKHLSDQQRRAYVIADNAIATKSAWDVDLLKLELCDLSASGFDVTLTGFDEGELAGYLGNFDVADELVQGQLSQTDKDKHTCPACGEEFED